jgi:Na+/H+-dicarboxylate symporter
MTTETIIAVSILVALIIGIALGYYWRDLAAERVASRRK